MPNISKGQILSKISKISFSNGIKLQDMISDIIIKNENIGFSIEMNNYQIEEVENIKNEAIGRLKEINGIGKITIVLTNSKLNKSTNKPIKKHLIENVSKIILVASGKGGVGKSTIAALIAETLNLEGHKVGIVDADIYGPSIPHIFNVNKKPDIIDNKMIPIESRNIQIISIGFMIDRGAAIAWRGPLATKAIYQLLSMTLWNKLDYLIIDMPPGTGDIHLSILENYKLDGVILVTTPQKISEIDVKKSIELYQKFNLPILGIIENMSFYVDPNSGKEMKLFSGNSGEYLSKQYNIPLIHKLGIIPSLSENCDQGRNLTDIATLSIKQFIS